MTTTVKKSIKTATAALIALLSALLLYGLPASARAVHENDIKKMPSGIRGRSKPAPNMDDILTVLESRISDRKLLDKAKEKLAGLREKDVRLIASLCERILADGHNAGSDIAFLLATALVVLS